MGEAEALWGQGTCPGSRQQPSWAGAWSVALLGTTSSRGPGKPAGARPQVGVRGQEPQERQGERAPQGRWLLSPTRAWPPRGRRSHLQLREGRPGHLGAGQPRAAPVTPRQASLCKIPVRTSLVAERIGVGLGAGDTGSIPGPGRFHRRQKY